MTVAWSAMARRNGLREWNAVIVFPLDGSCCSELVRGANGKPTLYHSEVAAQLAADRALRRKMNGDKGRPLSPTQVFAVRHNGRRSVTMRALV
jgi:hypothetical protein